MATDPFRPLRLEYLEGAYARVDDLRALCAALGTEKEAPEALRKIAHNLRGSGGFYGFLAISETAAVLEEMARSVLSGAPCSPAELTQAVEDLVAAILKARVPD